jgi:hypothetical protein
MMNATVAMLMTAVHESGRVGTVNLDVYLSSAIKELFTEDEADLSMFSRQGHHFQFSVFGESLVLRFLNHLLGLHF